MQLPKQVTVSGVEITLNPMPIFTALRLDKRLMTILAPIVGDLKNFMGVSLDSDISVLLEALGGPLERALSALPAHELEQFMREMLAYAAAPVQGRGMVTLDDESAAGAVFAGNLLGLYQVVFEVAKFNKFVPFALGGIGQGTQKTTI